MKKSVLTVILAAIMICALPGCRANPDFPDNSIQNPDPTSDISSKEDLSNSVSSASPRPNTNDQSQSVSELIKEYYDTELSVKPANEVFEITVLDLPEQINGHSVSFIGLADSKNFIVVLYDAQGASGIICGAGLYNIENSAYLEFPDFTNDNIAACDGKYAVFKEYDADFLASADDESVKLWLYDLNNKERKLIYTYSFDRNVELYGGHWKNNIALSENKVYFDDFINGENSSEWRAVLYFYDIETGEITKFKEDAQNPFCYKNNILYLEKNNGHYDLMVSPDGEYDILIKGHPNEFASLENGIFSLNVLSSDDEKKLTTWGIINNHTDEYILMTTRTISNLAYSEKFLAFTDFGIGYPPVVYSADGNCLAVFENLIGHDVSWYFSGGTGIVRDYKSGEAYIFKVRSSQ